MTEVVAFFKDYGPLFAFCIGIASLCAGLYYFLKNKKEKKMEYFISNKTPLFNQLHSKIKIFFNEQEINENACLSMITLKNIGNEPIKEDEFEKGKALKINFSRKGDSPVRIFDVEIYRSNPSDFDVEFDYTNSDGIISIKPILFNPKDYITLKLISSEFEEVSVSGRIIGGNIVNGSKRKKRRNNSAVIMFCILSIALAILNFSDLLKSVKGIAAIIGASVAFGISYITEKIIRKNEDLEYPKE